MQNHQVVATYAKAYKFNDWYFDMTKMINVDLDAGSVELSIGSSSVRASKDDMPMLFEALKGAYLLLSATRESDAALANDYLRELGMEGLAEAAQSIPGAKKKRKSRKRVGDALIVWLDKNPGWHSEEALLEAVVVHKMTDADPKRALKIALGKQKEEVFVTDGLGRWCLAGQEPEEGRWRLSASEASTIREKLLG